MNEERGNHGERIGRAYLQERKGKGGQPEIIDEEKIKKVVSLLLEGNFIETAFSFVGIAKDTYYRWLKNGARDRELYAKQLEMGIPEKDLDKSLYHIMSDSIEKAMATSEALDLRTIKLASEKNWFAAAWRLERRYPKKWGRTILETQDHPADNADEAEVIILALPDNGRGLNGDNEEANISSSRGADEILTE